MALLCLEVDAAVVHDPVVVDVEKVENVDS
jgi:hypothetical protein